MSVTLRFASVVKSNTRALRIAATATAFIAVATAAQAGTATDTFNVTATVNNECLVDASDLAFGTYSISSGAPNTASSNISVTCTNGTTYAVALNGGVNGSLATRQMRNTDSGSTAKLSYQLYTTSAYSTVWGDGSTGVTQAGTGSGTAQNLTVYGSMPVNQAATPGSYLDTITVTVAY
ncbi:Csu type fimbrial protein [Radicibacter daui]|uniref:Csu type fimbrial protein n=1 Tax=Radicibacter daui TaxID=3064829 RepID=UPI004046F7F2